MKPEEAFGGSGKCSAGACPPPRPVGVKPLGMGIIRVQTPALERACYPEGTGRPDRRGFLAPRKPVTQPDRRAFLPPPAPILPAPGGQAPTRRAFFARHALGGFRSEQRGEALVEFALLAPVVILLLLAMVDFGRVFDAWLVTTNAAREGARYAAVYSTKDYITDADVVQMSKQKAYEYLISGLGPRSDVAYSINDISVSLPPTRWAEPVTVDVSIRVQIWALLDFFLSNQATISSSATMRI